MQEANQEPFKPVASVSITLFDSSQVMRIQRHSAALNYLGYPSFRLILGILTVNLNSNVFVSIETWVLLLGCFGCFVVLKIKPRTRQALHHWATCPALDVSFSLLMTMNVCEVGMKM